MYRLVFFMVPPNSVFLGLQSLPWVMTSPEGHHSDKQLAAWLQKGIEFASSLPPKKKK
jgi:hypothetical protein